MRVKKKTRKEIISVINCTSEYEKLNRTLKYEYVMKEFINNNRLGRRLISNKQVLPDDG